MALLPPFPRLGLDGITLVQTAQQAQAAWQQLSEHRVWGFDTESKPTFFKDQVSDGPHVLQLSTTRHAWVIQLHDADCCAEVAHWLADPHHLKAGFGLGDDKKRLLRKLNVEPAGVVELNTLFRQRGYRREMGVKAAVAVLFGQCFAKSKKAATSNWSLPRLSESQLMYAANDAYAAAWVYQALQTTAAPGSGT
jgi:ribonuclease D